MYISTLYKISEYTSVIKTRVISHSFSDPFAQAWWVALISPLRYANCQLIFPMRGCRAWVRKWPSKLTLGKRSQMSLSFYHPCCISPRISSDLKSHSITRHPLNLWPIDQGSGHSHKYRVRVWWMDTQTAFSSIIRIGYRRDKGHKGWIVCSGIKRYLRLSIPCIYTSWFHVFCPPVAPIEWQMCASCMWLETSPER